MSGPAAGERVLATIGSSPVTSTPAISPTATISLTCIIGKKVDELKTGLAGWTIHARPREASEPILSTMTDSSGDFHFAGLAPGWWTLWEDMQPEWTAVTAGRFDIELQPGPCAEVLFMNRRACAMDAYEPDDNAGQAALILLGRTAQRHTLEPPADQDWVEFDATAGITYTLATGRLVKGTDTVLSLYDTNGYMLLATNDDRAPGDPSSLIAWQALRSGRYFARVRNYYQSGALGCLGYDLTLTAAERYLPLMFR